MQFGIRGIQQLANKQGVIIATALDHQISLKYILQQGTSTLAIGYDELVAEKIRMASAFSSLSSAILLDPIYGAAQAIAAGVIPGGTGLIVALEAPHYQGSDESRINTIIDGWSVAKSKRLGAVAVKLAVDYHPKASTARYQEDLVKRVAEECHQQDIVFLLEPLSYSIEPGMKKESLEFAHHKPEIVLESARRLGRFGVDLLKCEFPDDPHYEHDEVRMRKHCRQLTENINVPWLILSAGERFDTFQHLVQLACEEGASGFIVGRALWQEVMGLPTAEEREKGLYSTALSRLEILKAIANHHAHPWHERYMPLEIKEHWNLSYH